MSEITKLNIYRKIGEVKKLISTWQARNLTPYGKVSIITSLLMSKFTHMLLSLPSPTEELFEELNTLFKGFLWSGKSPKYRHEILEAETKDGGLKLHNIKLFDNALKLGWLKRYIRSNSKWTVFPNDFELEGVFIYGPDYLERNDAMISNPFWINVIDSLKLLWNCNFALERSVILETPLWLNPIFKLQINREWKDKGITVISDLIDYSKKLYSMADFIQKYQVKTNFLEYARVSIKVNEYLNWRSTLQNTENLDEKNPFLTLSYLWTLKEYQTCTNYCSQRVTRY